MSYPPNDPLPTTGFLVLSQIIGNKKSTPPIPAIIPVSRSTWWEGVKTGRFPMPVKLGDGRTTFWRVEDILAVIASAQPFSLSSPKNLGRNNDDMTRQPPKHRDESTASKPTLPHAVPTELSGQKRQYGGRKHG